MSVSQSSGAGVTVRTTGRWFGDAGRPTLGWLSVPEGGVGGSGVVIAPPVGYPYLSSHRTLRVLAETMASRGHAVLRFDYDGTGDSGGDQWDGGRVAAWRATVARAVEEVRSLGVARMTLAGVRLGATFALLDASGLAVDEVIAWSPVVDGRRYAKELRLMSIVPPEDATEVGTVASAGNVFSAETLGDIRALSLDGLSRAPASRVCVIDGAGGGAASLVDGLRALSVDVRLVEVEGAEAALETSAEYATVPQAVVDAFCACVGTDDTPRRSPRPTSATAEIDWRGGTVVEELLVLEPGGHRGLVTRPRGPSGAVGSRATLTLLNPGSETHVGPGRMWVELARDLALRGHPVIRVDMHGWGESPDDGRAPGRPYDEASIPDTRSIVDALIVAGYERVVLSGLCASSWIALHALRDGPAAGAVVFNPQLLWRSDIPLMVDPEEVRRYLAPSFARHRRGQRVHLWDLLDAVGLRPAGGRLLDRMMDSDKPIVMVFTADDVGLEYVQTRLSRQLARARRTSRVDIDVIDIDHPMHRAWQRACVTDAAERALTAINATD